MRLSSVPHIVEAGLADESTRGTAAEPGHPAVVARLRLDERGRPTAALAQLASEHPLDTGWCVQVDHPHDFGCLVPEFVLDAAW